MMTRINQIIGFSEMVGEQLVDAGVLDVMDDLKKVANAAKELQGMIEANLSFSTEAPVVSDGIAASARPAIPASFEKGPDKERLEGHFLCKRRPKSAAGKRP